MYESLLIKTPAKINLLLEVLGKRDDGFHEIRSIMQAISLYDYLTITVKENEDKGNSINLTGNSDLIPYDNKNLCYKASQKFLELASITNKNIIINIEKNIPVTAGLAGGSSNAAGTLLGLNKIFNETLDTNKISDIASEIGSDVNFCLYGGTQLATSRGELLEKLPCPDLNIVVVKPFGLEISAKEAYDKFSKKFLPYNKQIKTLPKFLLGSKPELDSVIKALKDNDTETIALSIHNDLEKAVIEDYAKIQDIKNILLELGCLNAIMSGSGPSVFGIFNKPIEFSEFSDDFEVFKVNSVKNGVIIE